jgi:hypothetical protein
MTTTAFLALALLPGAAGGHGGGLDRNGCHTDSRTGVYHCHGGGSGSGSGQSGGTSSNNRATRSTPTSRSSTATGIQPLSSAGTITMAASVVASQRELILTAQTLLAGLGYQVALDGALGPDTVAAVRQFQGSTGGQADGKVSGQLLVDLAGKVRERLKG